jgi:hypothetical protein
VPKRLYEATRKGIAVLKSVLVEFQEAQCYFMVASQAAVLTTIVKGSQEFEAATFSQVQTNSEMAALIGYAGILPTIYVMLNLYTFSMSSWYTLGISGASLILGTATLAGILTSNSFGFVNINIDVLNLDPGFELLDQCGKKPPPIIYCALLPSDSSDSSLGDLLPTFGYININSSDISTFDPIILLCWLVYAAIVLLKVLSYWSTARWQKIFRTSIIIWIFKLTLILSHATFLAFLGYYIAVLASMSTYVDKGAWTLGQIISVTIWAPVICKLVYLAFRKSPTLAGCVIIA